MPGTVNLFDPATKRVFVVDESEAPAFIADGWRPETPLETAERTNRQQVVDDNSGVGDKIQATLGQAANIATLGGSDALGRLAGGEGWAEHQRVVREVNPGATAFGTALGLVPSLASGGSGALGELARLTPAGGAARLGAGIARAGEEAGALTRVARGASGAAVEGGIYGAGEGVSDLALADDPLTMERVASTLSHRTLFGAGVGGVAGGALSGLEVGLGAARRRLTRAREALARGEGIPDDLAMLDRKGLREAQESELARIEAERVPQRQQLVDDFAAYREAGKVEKPWEAVATGSKGKSTAPRKPAAAGDLVEETGAKALTWKEFNSGERMKAALAETGSMPAAHKKIGADWQAYKARLRPAAADDAAVHAGHVAEDEALAAAAAPPRWMREQGKIAFEADKAADRLLRNPKALAERPQALKAVLQQEEHALEQILAKADELKVIHATDRSGRRAAALEGIPGRLERNRALQARIDNLVAAPSSPRLAAIRDAADALANIPKKTLGQQMAAGAAYGLAADLTRMVPVIGPMAAPLVGARIADAIGGKLGPQLLAATRQVTERATKAVDAFLAVTKSAQRVAPRLAPIAASKVLAGTRFAPANDETPPPAGKRKPAAVVLEESFDKRADELAASVGVDPASGQPKVRPHVRAAIADRLSGLAAVAPHVADRLETHAVARLLFLHGKLPKRPMLGMKLLRPSEMEIRGFARYVEAAENPGGIEERLADGTITMEDVEVMQALYPERLASITAAILEGLPTLRAELPYHRRLALSLLTGVAVDPAMEPHILAALQAQYEEEPDTEGGTQAPQPKPAFGSVKKSIPNPTPAQLRAGGAHP